MEKPRLFAGVYRDGGTKNLVDPVLPPQPVLLEMLDHCAVQLDRDEFLRLRQGASFHRRRGGLAHRFLNSASAASIGFCGRRGGLAIMVDFRAVLLGLRTRLPERPEGQTCPATSCLRVRITTNGVRKRSSHLVRPAAARRRGAPSPPPRRVSSARPAAPVRRISPRRADGRRRRRSRSGHRGRR